METKLVEEIKQRLTARQHDKLTNVIFDWCDELSTQDIISWHKIKAEYYQLVINEPTPPSCQELCKVMFEFHNHEARKLEDKLV